MTSPRPVLIIIHLSRTAAIETRGDERYQQEERTSRGQDMEGGRGGGTRSSYLRRWIDGPVLDEDRREI